MKSKSILTRKEASELLSVSLTTLRAWSDQGIIPVYKLGGRIYYKQKRLLKALIRIKVKGSIEKSA